jgi:hypothetical protein
MERAGSHGSYEARTRFDVFKWIRGGGECRTGIAHGAERGDLEPYHTAVADAENRYRCCADGRSGRLGTIDVLYESYREQLRALGRVIDIRRREHTEARPSSVDRQFHTKLQSKAHRFSEEVRGRRIKLALQTFRAS